MDWAARDFRVRRCIVFAVGVVFDDFAGEFQRAGQTFYAEGGSAEDARALL